MKRLHLQSLAAAMAACLIAPAPAQANLPSPGLAEVQELAKAGRGAEALRKVDALIAKHPQDPHLRFQKGVLLVEQKRTAEAIALFERMSREYPTLPEPLNNLAVLYAEQGQIEKARAALESAVRSRPSYDTAYQNLSSVNVRMASRAYARALQIDDSAGAPKLALLGSLNGSQQDGPVTVAALTPPAPPAPPPASTAPTATPTPPSSASVVSSPATVPVPTKLPAPASAPAEASVKNDAGDPITGSAVTRANPATVNTAQRQTADTAREINAAVRAWANAWQHKDLNTYFGAYVPGYRGTDGNATAWQAGRRLRILSKSRISVELSGVTVEQMPNNAAKVSFRQDYLADQLKASGQKVLEMVKRDGKWFIRKESVG